MKKKTEVIQIGASDWREQYPLPSGVNWHYRSSDDPTRETEESEAADGKKAPKDFDVVILDGAVDEEYMPYLLTLGAAYVYFYTDRAHMTEGLRGLIDRKLAVRLSDEEIPAFLRRIPIQYFRGQEGSKLKPGMILAAHDLQSKVITDGNRCIAIEDDFGDTLRPVFQWKYNITLRKEQPLELWLEYTKSGDVTFAFKVRLFQDGSLCELLWTKVFTEEELSQPLIFFDGQAGYLACEVFAKGKGRLEMGNLHFRQSRLDAGQFLAGGERHADPTRREFISYFDPGDLKPPLNVYFSGYRTAEGFEGYFIMKRMQSPFLLIGDPRLEGGGFYMGTPEFEQSIVDVIQAALDRLGFTRDQLILSGMSMGTFGAAYYACDLLPHAVIIGKPLMNIGNVASNEKRLRPGGFPTSLDVLRSTIGGNTPEDAEQLNERFWKKFDAADFSRTRFVISYMYQDDYDMTGYPDILAHLQDRRVPIVSKGLEGRHNDNTSGIVSWFMSQYRRVLRSDFGKEVNAV